MQLTLFKAHSSVHVDDTLATAVVDQLERFPADVNRGGFPRVQFSDSGFMLMKEVGMDGSRAFTGSS